MDYVITAGDVSSGLSLGSDDSLYVEDGGTAIDTTAESSNIQNYGMTTGTTLEASEEVNYGEADDTTVYGGGDISTYGDISGTVADGGHVTIYSGGNAYGTFVSGPGAREAVLAEDGSVTLTTTVANGGTVDAIDGAAIYGTLVVMSGGGALLGGSGTTTDDSVNGGIEATTGNLVSATVTNSGLLTVQGSGLASGVTVSSGGIFVVEAGGAAADDTNVGAGGTMEVAGTTSGTLLSGAFFLDPYTAIEIVERSGTASGTLIDSDGVEQVASGGSAVSAQLQEYGVMTVSSGGSAVFITYNGGIKDAANGYLSVKGGTTTSTTLIGYAIEYVTSGGVASDTVVSSAAEELVSGGVINGSVLLPAGGATVTDLNDEDGYSISATVSSSAELAVQAGGEASYTTVSFGGIESVNSSGATASTTVNAGGEEKIYTGASVYSLVMNLGGMIDLPNLTYSSGGSAVMTAPGMLTVTEGQVTSAVDLAANSPGGQTAAKYSVSPDTGLGTLVIATSVPSGVPCFARSTMILTEHGPCAVEALRIGDLVVTAGGASRPVIWLGQRQLNCHTHAQPDLVLPIRICVGAIADSLPSRDLYLSPDHSLFLDEVLIPAKHLVNGRSIAQTDAASIEYWHVELDSHDILLAEGLPVESYLDTGSRANFTGGAAVSLHPNFAARTWDDACAELVQGGPRLVAAKQRLFERASQALTRPIPGLRVFAEKRELTPVAVAPDCLAYRLPAGVRSVMLMSPSWVPAFCEAASLDRRRLGVRLFDVLVDGINIDLSGPAFISGFHPVEWTAEGQCCWTTGDARLVLPPTAECLVLHVGDGIRAPLQEERWGHDEHSEPATCLGS